MSSSEVQSDRTAHLQVNAVWQQIEARGFGFSDSLLLLVEAARRITRADGVAVALCSATDPESIICYASTGAAPAVGTSLDPRSGLSGYCFRSGRPVLCNDTSNDARVEAEACRCLNLASVVIVPLFEGRVIGILEALSSKAGSFDEDDLSALCRLANIAVALHRGRAVHANPPQPATPAIPAGAVHTTLQPPSPRTSGKTAEEITPTIKWLLDVNRKHTFKTVLAMIAVPVVVACLLVAVALWPRHSAQKTEVSMDLAPASLPTGNKSTGADPGTIAHDSTTPQRRFRSKSSAARVTPKQVPADDGRPESAVITDAVPTMVLQGSVPSARDNTAGHDGVSGVVAAQAVDPPPLDSLTKDGAAEEHDLRNVVSEPPVEMPRPWQGKALQGVTPVRLIHETQPAYPAGTESQQATVVLQATIATNGGVKDVHAISGPSAFAASAIAAVKNWRYKPSLLNGKPVEATTSITVKFKPTE